MEASHKRSSMSQELMKLALKELQNARDHIYLLPENEQPLTEEQILNRINAAITVLHQEVYRDVNDTSQKCAEKQEPVAWMYVNEDGECEQIEYGPVFDDPGVTPLYTAPPKKEWVGLTAYEIQEIHSGNQHWGDFAESIEEKLKEKNT